jgi:hypothetical protein
VAVEVGIEARKAPYDQLGTQLVEYLNTHAEAETGHEGEFVLVEGTDRADIVVQFQPSITSCGDQEAETSFYYCYDRGVSPDMDQAGQHTVRVSTLFTTSAVDAVTKTSVLSMLGLGGPEDAPETGYSSTAQYAYHDPWPGQNELVVGIENPVGTSANMTRIVQSSLDYWEANDNQYALYQANWTLDPDAEDPDVVVQFVEDIPYCGLYEGEAIGCASLLNQSLADPPEVARIEVGYTEDSMINTTKHEFGHLYGLNHSSPPQPLMAAEGDAKLLPVENASEREYPFNKSSLTVYISDESSELSRDTIVTEASRALDYYAAGADGYVGEETSFSIIDNRSAADIVLNVGTGQDQCRLEAGSCSKVTGENLDSDRALEVYTKLEIYVFGIPEDTFAWHVGTQMTYLSNSGSPPPFDGDGDDRDSWYR